MEEAEAGVGSDFKKTRVLKAAEMLEKKSEKYLVDLARWRFCRASRRAASWWSAIKREWGLGK